jgi:amino acid adenylation domain-containing protein
MSAELLVADRVRRIASDSVALRDSAGSLSYGELNRRADRLAHHLQTLGVGRGSAVAICLVRSFDQIVAELAALRAGAAFVPIDPAWPDERVQHIVADSGASVFIAPKSLTDRVALQAIALDVAAWPKSADEPAVPSAAVAGSDLAYIIYTSGSTGVPKGVEITHANLNHLIAWHLEAFDVTASDHATHVAGLGFDAAVWEIWPYLAVGASISLADEMARIDPATLQRWIVESGVTISFVPTPVAEPMLAMEWPAATRLRVLLTGGDTLHMAPKTALPFRLVNNYGPTECTVVATSGDVVAGTEGLPSIGKAIAGTTVYLLDEAMQPVAAGVVGEMYLGGRGVGRGYRNLPEQTAKSFVADPFSEDGGRMYRTGDMAKWLPDGQIAFLGRVDSQEKIRGNRIELDEIISVLNRHEAVAFNVVVASKDPAQEKHLIAYVLLAEGAKVTSKELQEFAAAALPSYMIPAKFVRLESLPLSANGKTDRNALPAPTEENLLPEAASREPKNELEEALLALVRELLKTNDVGVEDDFFLVGGHSLLGTQLVLRARERFGVMLTLRDLFETATVEGLAAHIEELILEEINAMSEEEAVRMVSSGAAE